MKTFVTSILICLAVNLAIADCSSLNYDFINLSDSIPQGGKIILNLYSGNYSLLVSNYPNKAEFVLIDENNEYPLELTSITKGYNQIQVVFEVPKNTPVGNYKLGVLPKEIDLQIALKCIMGNSGFLPKILHDINVISINQLETNSTNETFKFELIKSEYQEYGCGPAAYNQYSIDKQVDRSLIFETKITSRIDTSSKRIAFIAMDKNNKISIGHSMCYGEFDITPNVTYDLTIKTYSTLYNKYLNVIETEIRIRKDSNY